MDGFVSFVSSGPGDPELLTRRAADRLDRADVVLYDDLSSGPILAIAAKAMLIRVGKRAGRPSAKQTAVNALILKHARTGKRVVRLKSGDAGMFGRLEEELTAVRGANIPFEIVPGVSSVNAAAAMAGIPLTRRLTARRVQYVTGADITGRLPDDLNWNALTDPKSVTVVFMGQRTFPELANELIARGLSPDTPALIAEAVTKEGQRLRHGTISELASTLHRDGPSSAPALIFYGPLTGISDGIAEPLDTDQTEKH